MSIKKTNVAETSSFATFSGIITETGQAQIKILMDSIDTKIDLRNVRMRFLFFETFKFPEATITASLDPAVIADLRTKRRMIIDLPYTLDVHGVEVQRTDRAIVSLLDNDTVTISAAQPIPIALKDFNLEEGRQKLQEAAGVDIVPVGTIGFNFLFRRSQPGSQPELSDTVARSSEVPGSAALETKGDFDETACLGRFEILSNTGNINFQSGSADIDPSSDPLLRNLVDIVKRCPGMVVRVAGHTDADGSEWANQRLSEARARAVARYLISSGIQSNRVDAVGFGESRPIVPNTSPENKRRNRRIEFSVLDG